MMTKTINIITKTLVLGLLIGGSSINSIAQKIPKLEKGKVVFSNSAYVYKEEFVKKSKFSLDENIYCYARFFSAPYGGEPGGGFNLNVYINDSKANDIWIDERGKSHDAAILTNKNASGEAGRFTLAVLGALLNAESYGTNMKIHLKLTERKDRLAAEGFFELENFDMIQFKKLIKTQFLRLHEFPVSQEDSALIEKLGENFGEIHKCYWNNDGWTLRKNSLGEPLYMLRHAVIEYSSEGKFFVRNFIVRREHIGGGNYSSPAVDKLFVYVREVSEAYIKERF